MYKSFHLYIVQHLPLKNKKQNSNQDFKKFHRHILNHETTIVAFDRDFSQYQELDETIFLKKNIASEM